MTNHFKIQIMKTFLQDEISIQIHIHKLKEIEPNIHTKCGRVRFEVIKYWEDKLIEMKLLKTRE